MTTPTSDVERSSHTVLVDLSLGKSVTDERTVSAILERPADPHALLVLAHGAGAGMLHPHLERISRLLAEHGVAVLRHQFPYTEDGRKRPDAAPRLEATVRAAARFGAELCPGLPLFVGGRSMGARMNARAEADRPQSSVRGLVFFAFPLHRPLKKADPDPELERAEHLHRLSKPLLFLQGTRDTLARIHLVRGVVGSLPHAELFEVEEGDHSFKVPKRTGKTLESVEQELAQAVSTWTKRLATS